MPDLGFILIWTYRCLQIDLNWELCVGEGGGGKQSSIQEQSA